MCRAEVEAAQARRLALGIALEHRLQQRAQVAAQPIQLAGQTIEVFPHLALQRTEFQDRRLHPLDDFVQRIVQPVALPTGLQGERRGPAQCPFAPVFRERSHQFLETG
ncbi:hypothetical protein D9M68_810250 [compost metagenome]